MKRAWRWMIGVMVAVIAMLLLVYAFSPQPVAVDVVEVTRGPMQVGIEEDGQTRIRERFIISAPLAGRLQRITLDPGDPVTAGETLLALIDPTDPSLLDARSQAEAEARVRMAEAALARAEAVLQREQATSQLVQNDHRRIIDASERNASTSRELDQANLLLEAARQEVRSAEFARDVARFELEQATAALLHTRPDGSPKDDGFPILSPVTGTVLRLFQQSMAVVAPGTTLLEVGDPADLEVIVDVLSTDAVRIRPGDQVIIERWGGSEPLRGAVRLIEPAAFTKVSSLGVEEQRVNVVIDLMTPQEQRVGLGDGFRVEVRIVQWSNADVLQVPAGALFRKGDQWFVFAIIDWVAREHQVEIGHRNGMVAEVLSGLHLGDTVVAYPSDRVVDGVRVTRW